MDCMQLVLHHKSSATIHGHGRSSGFGSSHVCGTSTRVHRMGIHKVGHTCTTVSQRRLKKRLLFRLWVDPSRVQVGGRDEYHTNGLWIISFPRPGLKKRLAHHQLNFDSRLHNVCCNPSKILEALTILDWTTKQSLARTRCVCVCVVVAVLFLFVHLYASSQIYFYIICRFGSPY